MTHEKKAIHITLQANISSLVDFADFYQAMSKSFAPSEFIECCAPYSFGPEGIVIAFAKLTKGGVLVSRAFTRISLDFYPDFKVAVFGIAIRLAILLFGTEAALSLESNDLETLNELLHYLLKKKLKIEKALATCASSGATIQLSDQALEESMSHVAFPLDLHFLNSLECTPMFTPGKTEE